MVKAKKYEGFIRPLCNYMGNKFRLITFLKEHIKNYKDKLWVEPFLGSAAVLFNFEPNKAVCSEINNDLLNLLEMTKDKEKLKSCFLYIKSISENLTNEKYYEIRDEFNKDKSSEKFLFLQMSCFNGICRYNSKGLFNGAFNKRKPEYVKNNLLYWLDRYKQIHNILNKHTDWEFYNIDFRELMKKHCSENSICYLDPPYFNTDTAYHTAWKKSDTIELLQLIKKLPGKFFLSSCLKEGTESILDLIDFKYNLYSIDLDYTVGGPIRQKATEILIEKI